LGIVFLCFVLFFSLKQDVSEKIFWLATTRTDIFSGQETKVFLSEKDLFVSNPVLSAVEKNSLRAVGPVTFVQTQSLASYGSGRTGWKRKDISEYEVQPGDTLSSIAAKFGISLSTLLWENDLSKNSVVPVGKKLTILPVSGVTHLVREGESVSYLAEIHKTEQEKIIEFNELPENNKIVIGDLLIIPDGRPASRQTAVSAPLASSYFICPIPRPCGITQGLHWYNAIDFSNGKCGEAVFASAGGTVQKTGYHDIAGNYIRILHPNGIVTFYGHLSRISVRPGQKVYQGQIIGRVGNTGYTLGPTGCHVHFEVRGARNPFAY